MAQTARDPFGRPSPSAQAAGLRLDSHSSTSRAERWIDRRLGQKGLRPRDAAYLIGAFWAVAVVVFGVIERLIDPKTFHTVWLGMWWAVETVTTVGYGDVVPSQTAGKVIAGFLMLGGLSLLAVVTAAITSGFVSRAETRRRATEEDPVLQKLDQLTRELQAVKTELAHARPLPPALGSSPPETPTGPVSRSLDDL